MIETNHLIPKWPHHRTMMAVSYKDNGYVDIIFSKEIDATKEDYENFRSYLERAFGGTWIVTWTSKLMEHTSNAWDKT